MAELSLEKAYGALKRREIPPAYYLTGSEDILKDELIDAIADATVEPAARAFNFDVRSAGDLSGESLHALVETPPMLADRRLVVVRGLDQWRKNANVWKVLHRYLAEPSATTVLVLTQAGDQPADRKIVARTAHVAINGLKPAQLQRWVRRRAERAGVVLEPEAAEHLLAAVGGDLGHLAAEIEKLAAALPAGEPATAASVATLIGVRHGETVHDWVDALLARDAKRAAAILDPVLRQAGVSAVQMVTLLGTALTGVRVARALLDGGTPPGRLERAVFQALRAARPARLRRWGVEAASWARAAQRWSARDLERALAAAYDADKLLKSTRVTGERGVLHTVVLHLTSREAA